MNSSDVGLNTVFLRLEGPLQAWGDTSKFVIRRSMEAPTKSGVLGLICCAMGLSRKAARDYLLELNTLAMGVRIDRMGTRWWDYHTVGAGTGMTTAAGGLKSGAQGTLIKRLEYLADASFLVALKGDGKIVERVADALRLPKWTLFLGRKSCLPSMPVLARPHKGKGEKWTNPISVEGDVGAALNVVPWSPRYKHDVPRDPSGKPLPAVDLVVYTEWRRSQRNDVAPPEAEVWYDSPVCFDPPVHEPRLVMRKRVTVRVSGAIQEVSPSPPRPRANYRNKDYQKSREQRLKDDAGLCVFCKQTATTVQHVTYRRGGGHETLDDLRALCRLCHDSVTMIEYGLGMGLDRIDPCDPRWRDDILHTRCEIVRFRSEETRRRALRDAPEPVRREMFEEEGV